MRKGPIGYPHHERSNNSNSSMHTHARAHTHTHTQRERDTHILTLTHSHTHTHTHTHTQDLYGIVDEMLQSTEAWLVMVLTCSMPILLEVAYRAYCDEYQPDMSRMLQEKVNRLACLFFFFLLSPFVGSPLPPPTLQHTNSFTSSD